MAIKLSWSWRLPGTLTAALALVVVMLATFQGVAKADVNGFTVKDFVTDYYLTNKDPQGQMQIVERINVDFTDQNHGIERAIPKTYGKHSVNLHVNKISSDSGAPVKFTTYTSNGNTVLRIGDAGKTVTGKQEYTVDYTVDNVISFAGGVASLYWDINGVGWGQPFDHVSANIHVPAGLNIVSDQLLKPSCYTGVQGSTNADCTISVTPQLITAETTKPLAAFSTLSIAVAFGGGYFRNYGPIDYLKDYWKPVVSFLALPLLVGGYGLRLWLKNGRDPKGRGVIVPEYDVVDKLSPVEVGALVDFKVANRDITALLISLAIRKQIRIIETRKNKLIGKDELTYELELLNADFGSPESKLSKDEQTLLKALFPEPETGQRKQMKTASSALYKVSQAIRIQTSKNMTAKGYFAENPLDSGKSLLLTGSGLVIIAFILASLVSPLVIAGAIVAGIIGFVFAKAMPARTVKGVEALEHVKGLKMYLQTAEAGRIKKMQSPNAAYADNRNEPAHTVELFEKLLPYAMVLGVEKDWAKQFESLYTQPPEWFAGNVNAFSAGYLVGSLNDGFNSAVNTSFTSPASSSDSGVGGGGFSGGGGGGGGGGGW